MKKFNEILTSTNYDDGNVYSKVQEIINDAFVNYENSETFVKVTLNNRSAISYYNLASQIMGVEKVLKNQVNEY